MRQMKREIKEKIHGHVHHSIKRAMESVAADLDNGDEGAGVPSEAKDEKSQVNIGEVLGDLKGGSIDVATALKRIRGEETAEPADEVAGAPEVAGDPPERESGEDDEGNGKGVGG